MPAKRHRINGFHMTTLIGVAFLLETLQLLVSFVPFAGGLVASLISLLAFLIFWVWFHILGVGFFDTTLRLVTRMIMMFTEIIPYVNILPILTIGTILVIWEVHQEDKKYNQKMQEAYQNQASAQQYFPNGTPKERA